MESIRLNSSSGASAAIYTNGAHLASWRTPDGRERLFFSRRAELRPGAALRGGVPVVFPQFSGLGPLPKHGFARNARWTLVGQQADSSGRATVRLRLEDSDETRRLWNHSFRLDLAVTVGGAQLEISLHVLNTDSQPFTFMAALHTYLAVSAIEQVGLEGLHGLTYREYEVNGTQPDGLLRVNGEIDRIFWNAARPVVVRDGSQTYHLAARGFPDVVVWNPGPARAAAIPDLDPEEYRVMLCVEAAVIGQPVTLAPGTLWQGIQRIQAG